MKDWKFMPQEADWCETRMKYTQDKSHLHCLTNVPTYYASEMLIEPDDDQARDDVFATAPGMKFAPGFNKDQGDTNISFKQSF